MSLFSKLLRSLSAPAYAESEEVLRYKKMLREWPPNPNVEAGERVWIDNGKRLAIVEGRMASGELVVCPIQMMSASISCESKPQHALIVAEWGIL